MVSKADKQILKKSAAAADDPAVPKKKTTVQTPAVRGEGKKTKAVKEIKEAALVQKKPRTAKKQILKKSAPVKKEKAKKAAGAKEAVKEEKAPESLAPGPQQPTIAPAAPEAQPGPRSSAQGAAAPAAEATQASKEKAPESLASGPHQPITAPVASASSVPLAGKASVSAPVPAQKKKLILTPDLTVKDLAQRLNVGIADLIKKLMSLGVWATINQRLDPEVAGLIVNDFGYEAEFPSAFDAEAAVVELQEKAIYEKVVRAPIVTIMGHVDHGKTTLLDAIRETNVVEKEAGGITQSISAFRVKTPKGDIVFLDTPGHEAFTAMRARGAKVTDLVILVVAADDGVMPQTVEAIDHAKAGGVPIVVAINKIDKPETNIARLKQELSNLGLIPEEWGGKTVMVEVSAKRRVNLEKLLEMILIEAELLELKASPKRPAVATVTEARKDPKRGTVVSILVSDGTLRVGDPFICGSTWGRVRALIDDHNVKLTQVGPSTPVLVLGFEDLPLAGERMLVAKNERQAKELAGRRKLEADAVRGKKSSRHLTLEDLHEKIEQGLVKEFKVVLRADTQGSLEAIVGELSRLRHEEVVISVIHSGVGTISLSDVLLAAASDAIILGFSVGLDPRGKEEAKKENVEIREYSIIYELMEDIKAALEGLLTPIITEKMLGASQVLAAFKVSGVGSVAGCLVSEGKMIKGSVARVLRDGNKLMDGKITSLKRIKEDVREVIRGLECGIVVSGYNNPRKGDRIESLEQIKELKKMSTASISQK
ncbi:MAG: translation initiation factor IF-2 [Elusimicrobiota bacterium]